MRFEPGQERTVELVALAGDRIVYGFRGAVMGRSMRELAARERAARSREASERSRGTR